MARLDRLTAVTMCVNYADFLAQTVSNRNYFDEWIVVTCREDHATRELCVRHGIRVHLSGQLGPWGDCFDSAYLKAPVINEVLSRLPQEGWVLLLDADLLLPQRFRERLGNYSLYPRALYGMYGRRECDSWEEYTWRRPVEPWAENIGYSSSVLGYFQLFRLDQPINRYPYARPKLEMHDDLCFQYGFKATLRRLLPMEGLHVGPPRVNWSGRHSGAFSGETEQVPARRVPQVLEHLKKVEVLWVIGADESMPWAVLAARAGKLVVVDWYGLEAEIDAAIVQADRRLLRKRLGEHWESLGLSPVLIPAERTRMEAAMETAPADAVFFVPELSADMAAALGPLFLKKGRKWPVLLGQFYGFPQWRSTALSVSVFFGVPDEVYTDGSWIVRNPVGMPMLRSGEAKDMEGVTMVVFCGNPGQVATLGEWVASGLRIPATQIAVFVRRHPHDGVHGGAERDDGDQNV